VTGASGQLGNEIIRCDLAHLQIVGLSRSELDITNAEQCLQVIGFIKPDIVIHAAAYTAVDQAESEPDKAWLVNVEGTRNVAKASEAVGASFCYISTDYVFDGMGSKPYIENDVTDPRTVYGNTKLEGERVALANNSKVFVVRTSWVYGEYGNNFVRTMLQFAKSKRELSVVHDQIGSPTYNRDLTSFLIQLVQTDKYGIYHVSNSGSCSWYEFAKAIFEQSGIEGITVAPCTTDQFPRPAPRPAYSVLGHNAMVDAGFVPLRHWREALNDFLSKMN
jgi:dTDP-4-dehydrorhamnose reductase